MKVPMSISVDVSRASELKERAEASGMRLSSYVNGLIDSALLLERGPLSATTNVPPASSVAEPDPDPSLDGDEQTSELSEDVHDSHEDLPDWKVLEHMSWEERVFNCVTSIPRSATDIATYAKLPKGGVQDELDELLDQGLISGRPSDDGSFCYWMPNR